MKKIWRILLIVLLIAVIAAAALAWHYRDYLRAFSDSRRYSAEDLQQQIDDNEAALSEIMERYLPQKQEDELTPEDDLNESVAQTPSASANSGTSELPAAPDAPATETKEDPEIVKIVAVFDALRTEYLARLEEMKSRAYSEYKQGDFSKKELADLAAGFVREATVLEVECDNKVFALLSELEKVIEKNGGDPTLPDKILDVYLTEKQLTKTKYISELEKRGLIL